MFRILFLLWFSFHPVHEAFQSLDYQSDIGNITGILRMYIDDFILDCGYGIKQDQANMELVKADDFEKGVRLTSDLTEQTFKVN